MASPLSRRAAKFNRVITLPLLVCIVAILVLSPKVTPLPSRMKRGNGVIITTDGGNVRGGPFQGAIEFLGIPYAKPPTGSRRWTPPEPCTVGSCWSGTFEGRLEYGDYCAQWTGSSTYGNEDCLFLNVWTPSISGKRPVLVYIHGNELMYGSGTDAGEHPTPELVLDMDVVGVSFNYRLNIFGFLALQALSADSETGTSGNYGLMDQIMALTWVKNNIANFGGDPSRVTIVGHSSGGTSALALLASPLASGLFHGAILMSPSAVLNKTKADAEHDNEVYLTRTNCNSGTLANKRNCLYRKSTNFLSSKMPLYVYPYWGMTDMTELPKKGRFCGALAIVDGVVVPNPPVQAMAEKTQINDVPIIIGTTAQEIDFQPGKDFTGKSFAVTDKHIRNYLQQFLSASEINEVFAMYEQYRTDPVLFYSTIVSDIRATCPSNVMAKNASIGFVNPVYRYVVTDWPSKAVLLPEVPGAKASKYSFHVWDIQAFFGFPAELEYVPSKQDKLFQKELRREFGAFIHTGRVSTAAWTGYPQKSAEFSGSGVIVNGEEYHKKACDFWASHGLLSYGWVN